MLPITINNPLAWVNMRLRGGWKTLISYTLAYTGIVVGAIILTVRADQSLSATAASNTLYYWTQGLMGLQTGVLVLFAGTAIRNAVRRDFATRMIESHRLMPVTGAQAVAGYIAGPSLQFLAIAAANLLIGMVTAGMSATPVQNWLFANFVLGIFVICLWFAAVFSGFASQNSFPLVIVLMLVSWFSQGALLAIAPGVSVLAGPLLDRTIFGIVERGGTWNWALQISAMAQLGAAGFCFLGAVRKYRRDDVLAFTPQMGLLLVAGWLILCGLAIQYPHEFSVGYFPHRSDESTQVIGSVLTAMLLGILPVSSAAWLRTNWIARRARRDVALGRPPVPPELIAISSAAVIALFSIYMRHSMWPYLEMTVGLSALAFLLAIGYLLGIMYRSTARATLITVTFLLVTWVLPFVVDSVRYAMVGDLDAPVMTAISTWSPIGALAAATESDGPQPMPGVAGQFIPAVILGVLYYRGLRQAAATDR